MLGAVGRESDLGEAQGHVTWCVWGHWGAWTLAVLSARLRLSAGQAQI